MQIFDVESAKRTILRRTAWDEMSVPHAVLDRIEHLFGERIGPEEAVRRILADVRARSATAVLEWSQRLDGVTPAALQVPPEAIRAAYDAVAPDVVEALRLAAARVEAFHRRQPTLSWIHNDTEGTLGQLVRPIERVGSTFPAAQRRCPAR
jgi:histidinol dehydrogenase